MGGALMERLKGQMWLAKSLLVAGGASVVDYSLVLTLAYGFNVSTVPATLTGVVIGAAINFTGNRKLVFKASGVPRNVMIWQFVRYVSVLAVLFAIHAKVVSWLRGSVGVPLVPSKMMADFVLLGLTQPLVFKYFVFRKPTSRSESPSSLPSPAPGAADPTRG